MYVLLEGQKNDLGDAEAIAEALTAICSICGQVGLVPAGQDKFKPLPTVPKNRVTRGCNP